MSTCPSTPTSQPLSCVISPRSFLLAPLAPSLDPHCNRGSPVRGEGLQPAQAPRAPSLFSVFSPFSFSSSPCSPLPWPLVATEGVLFAEKDFNLPKHPELEVPNLQVIKLMQSFKSKGFVRETFAWRHYYWYLTNEGIEHLRDYLNLPSEIVPATLKKSSRPPGRPMGAGGDRPPR
ncbi:unnamed protein product [Closterium sp. NIES-53]